MGRCYLHLRWYFYKERLEKELLSSQFLTLEIALTPMFPTLAWVLECVEKSWSQDQWSSELKQLWYQSRVKQVWVHPFGRDVKAQRTIYICGSNKRRG